MTQIEGATAGMQTGANGKYTLVINSDGSITAALGGGTAGAPSASVGSIQGVAGGTPVPVSGALTLSGSVTTELSTGLTPYSNTALLATKQQVKSTPGKLYGWMINNPSAAVAFIQVWDVANASITVGTTAPTYTIVIPTLGSANVFTDRGVTHATAINIAATTTATGSTAPGTALSVSLFYI